MTRPEPQVYLYRGLSMWPYFQEGDLLEVEKVPVQHLRVGDCVVLRGTDGSHVAHRVAGLRNGLVTRGDALPENDYFPENPPTLIGRVVRRHRCGVARRIAGGWQGRLAGTLYRYAGRIDPQRPGRGGRLARGIGLFTAPFARQLIRLGAQRTLRLANQGELTVWRVGGAVLATRNETPGPWQVRWPWRIVLTGLPRDNSVT